MTIIEAMQDPKLFGPMFRRRLLAGDSWRAWRAFLAVLFGLGLDEDTRPIFERHTGRTDSPSLQFREAFAIAGRRSGKSLIAALVAVFVACFRDYQDVLAPGEVGTVMILGADRRQCRVIFNYIEAFLSIPMLAPMVRTKLKESIELNNRIKIEIHTSSFRAVRGYTVVAAILDELAFWRDESSANPDSEVLTALRPAMATVPNGLLLGVSSPYAKRGELWNNYREHHGQPGSEVLVWKASSREMNPTLNPLTIATAYARDGASARAEYGGEFRDDIESFISVEAVESCVIAGRRELPFNSKYEYFGFTDPSGGRSDSFPLAIVHMEGDKALLDLLHEAEPPFSPEQVVAGFADTLKHFGISEVVGDKYGGEFPRELFEKRGITYRIADKTRSELYLEFLPMMMNGQVELLDNQRLVTQLVSLERRTGRGRDLIDHPPGSHDDLANAVAGALVVVLPKSATYGLLDLIKTLKFKWDGCVHTFRTPESPRTDLVGKQAALEFELQARGLASSRPQPPAPNPACCQCGAACTVKIGGVGLHCNSCGFDDRSRLPEIQRVTRADILSGRIAARGFANFRGGRS